MAKTRHDTTSRAVGRKASKQVRSTKATKSQQSVAGSTLAQRPDRKP